MNVFTEAESILRAKSERELPSSLDFFETCLAENRWRLNVANVLHVY